MTITGTLVKRYVNAYAASYVLISNKSNKKEYVLECDYNFANRLDNLVGLTVTCIGSVTKGGGFAVSKIQYYK